jgi:hypothetical protein
MQGIQHKTRRSSLKLESFFSFSGSYIEFTELSYCFWNSHFKYRNKKSLVRFISRLSRRSVRLLWDFRESVLYLATIISQIWLLLSSLNLFPCDAKLVVTMWLNVHRIPTPFARFKFKVFTRELKKKKFEESCTSHRYTKEIKCNWFP